MNWIVCLTAIAILSLAPLACAQGHFAEQVRATDQFEYSYSTGTSQEIVENWLDLSYYLGGIHTGLLLNSQQPAEEGGRENRIQHRFFEYRTEGVDIRAGHFYGLFGRGLLFAAYEDRMIRVDTALDGLLVSGRRGRLQGTVFTGAPSALERDVRGLDTEVDLGRGGMLGFTGLTHRADDLVEADGRIHREWAVAGRLIKFFSFGDCYFEYGRKKGYDYEIVPDDRFQNGEAYYGSVNVFGGPFALALEGKSYRKFTVLRRVDGKTALNRPPALVREHIYTLLNRAPLVLDPDDERGGQAELTYSGPSGWSALLNASRTERHNGHLVFEEAYGHVEKEDVGPLRLRGGFGYQDSEGRRQTVIGEITWQLDPLHSLTFVGEHQHVRLGGGPDFDLGDFDQQFLKLEYAVAPVWVFTAMLELNNKFDEQRTSNEKRGPFPAAQISYASSVGTSVALWAGKRQAGQLCSGGVCKFEPAFEGVELFGIIRY